jgi:hypothetical protein
MKKSLTAFLKYHLDRIKRQRAIFKGGAGSAPKPNFFKCFKKTEGMISFDEARLLYDLATEVTENCIVEIGSYRGRSTTALACGSLNGMQVPVFAIEPHENFSGLLGGEFGPQDRAAFYKTMLATGCYRIVRLVNLSSEMVAPHWPSKIALLFIDGNHSFEAVKRDFECWYPHLVKGTLIAFHDSRDPLIGPLKLIHALLATGKFKKRYARGEITVLELTSSTDQEKA